MGFLRLNYNVVDSGAIERQCRLNQHLVIIVCVISMHFEWFKWNAPWTTLPILKQYLWWYKLNISKARHLPNMAFYTNYEHILEHKSVKQHNILTKRFYSSDFSKNLGFKIVVVKVFCRVNRSSNCFIYLLSSSISLKNLTVTNSYRYTLTISPSWDYVR